MDWKTQNAKIEFDEAVVPAQTVASAIANTPHMMGRDMQYGGWLALAIPQMTDEASAKKVTSTLAKVKGVARAEPYLKQRAVGVQMTADGRITTAKLIEALAQGGIKATTF